MTYTVFGAGSVGTVLAGLLGSSGVDVRLCGRGAVSDLVLEGDEETVKARVPVVEEPVGTILLCVHEPDVAEVCAQWKGRTVVTFQNGVTAEVTAAQWCEVIGAVWRFTCTLEGPGHALFTRRGRVIVGRHPHGIADAEDAAVVLLADNLRRAGLDVGVSNFIAADKRLKLFVNLTSAPNALVRKEDHGEIEFMQLKIALLEEARDVLAAAGVTARSCDGKDPPIFGEIARQRRQSGLLRERPVFNSTWRLLSRGQKAKELYHDVIVSWAREAGVPAPRNERMLRILEEAREPECFGAAELLQRIETGVSGSGAGGA